MRLFRLFHPSDYVAWVSGSPGRYVLLNVTFGFGLPETIRMNVEATHTGYRRTHPPSNLFPSHAPPFSFLNPTLALSFSKLEEWKENFGLVHRAVGETPLGKMAVDAPAYAEILPRLQACCLEMAHIDQLLDTLPVATSLHLSYRQSTTSRLDLLTPDGKILPSGVQLLEDYQVAVAAYAPVPELRDYRLEEVPTASELSPRGRRLVEFLKNHREHALGWGNDIAYVAHELRPLRMTGADFRWRQEKGDVRRDAIDLLFRHQGHPAWCEVKMKGDQWTSLAILQVFYYGSMLSSTRQRLRLHNYYGTSFNQPDPWLAIIVEDRTDPGFTEDFEQALLFLQDGRVQQTLGEHYAGILVTLVDAVDGGWTAKRSQKIPWR